MASVEAHGVPVSYVAKVASKVAKKAAGKTISRGTWVVKKVSKGGSSAKTFKILDWTADS